MRPGASVGYVQATRTSLHVLYLPEAQGGLPSGPHALYALGTPTRLGRTVRTAHRGTPGADNEKTRRTDMLHLGKHFVGGRLCDLGGVPRLVSRVATEAQARATAGGLRLASPLAEVDVAV